MDPDRARIVLILISPYHLTTREPPAMAALLLAERVVTFLPAPRAAATLDDLRNATRASPAYRDFMESWRWMVPLWERGVVISGLDGQDARSDLLDAVAMIEADDRYKHLRRFMQPGLFDREDRFLQAFARDLLRGGPDPALSVPLAIALDAFAARHDLIVARASPTSIAQRAESGMGEPVFRIAVPVLMQAPAETILLARDLLAKPLDDLRNAMTDAWGECVESLSDAAAAYARAFEAQAPEIIASSNPDEVRCVVSTALIEGVWLSSDAAARSSLVAANRAMGRKSRRDTTIAQESGPPVAGLIVKAMGR